LTDQLPKYIQHFYRWYHYLAAAFYMAAERRKKNLVGPVVVHPYSLLVKQRILRHQKAGFL
jgi:hypothetical protein